MHIEKRHVVFSAAAVWVLLVFCSFWWNAVSARQERRHVALETGRAFFSQIVLTRAWNAAHGGVYVPVTEKTQPNPYLKTTRRDIRVDDGLTLTMVNPAFMTRQLSEMAEKEYAIKFHITSLRPLRPENIPSEWEHAALQSFEEGSREYIELVPFDGGETLRYMGPLITTTPCLRCHAEQGYREGDIRGGISITFPVSSKNGVLPLAGGHLLIGVCGLAILVFLGIRLESAYDDLKHQAIFDALTGIPNRRCFTERLFQELHRSKRDRLPLALILCDIDFFKNFNDTYGHQEGDECLKKIAAAIDKSMRRPADFCARYGGEEFVLVLPNTTKDGAKHVAEELRDRVESLQIIHGASATRSVVTLSLGVAFVEEDDHISDQELISRADLALYQAKHQGRNRVCVFGVSQVI